MSRFIAVISDGETIIHASAARNNYGTMCGVSIDDDEEVGREADLPSKPKIDCRVCAELIREAKKYRTTDISQALRSPTDTAAEE